MGCVRLQVLAWLRDAKSKLLTERIRCHLGAVGPPDASALDPLLKILGVIQGGVPVVRRVVAPYGQEAVWFSKWLTGKGVFGKAPVSTWLVPVPSEQGMATQVSG